MEFSWFSFVLGVVSVFAFLGLSIFAVALVVATKKINSKDKDKDEKQGSAGRK